MPKEIKNKRNWVEILGLGVAIISLLLNIFLVCWNVSQQKQIDSFNNKSLEIQNNSVNEQKYANLIGESSLKEQQFSNKFQVVSKLYDFSKDRLSSQESYLELLEVYPQNELETIASCRPIFEKNKELFKNATESLGKYNLNQTSEYLSAMNIGVCLNSGGGGKPEEQVNETNKPNIKPSEQYNSSSVSLLIMDIVLVILIFIISYFIINSKRKRDSS
jgi:hypothetical protein